MAKSFVQFKLSPRSFFNSAEVIKRVDPATRKVLSKVGAFIRRSAQFSIVKRKLSSVPGTPPSSHTGLLKRLIKFWYNSDNDSVIIGPEKAKHRGDVILSALEVGGLSTNRPRLNRRTGKRRRGRDVVIQARPFMGPALVENLPKLPAMWRDSITGS